MNKNNRFINLTLDNIKDECLCCIIRSKCKHPGVEAKRAWLTDRIKEGHVYRKLDEKSTVFIEYSPLETAWVPISGNNFNYIYCLWVDSNNKNKGYGKKLMEYAINDAKDNNKSGICMLGSNRQKNWLSNQEFAKKFGFKIVDSTSYGYNLLALSFDGSNPSFNQNVKNGMINNNELMIYYDDQCPYINDSISKISNYCKDNKITININKIDTLEKAKQLPCVFNNYAVFYNKKFVTVNLLDVYSLIKIIEKEK